MSLAAPVQPDCSALWVFGYGSLMWRPDFPFEERARAHLDGFHRAFCIRSTHHRGTTERPGLVLGLDQGGHCIGIAYRIAPAHAAATIAYLRERELIYGVYREARVPVTIAETGGGDGAHAVREVRALAYIAERRHPAYAGRLRPVEQAAVIRGARGLSGHNLDYLVNTVRQLGVLGISEPALARLVALAGAVAVRDRSGALSRAGVKALRNACWREPTVLAPISAADQRRFGYRARLSGSW